MRAKIRTYSICIIICMLITSMTGCKTSETERMDHTSASGPPDTAPESLALSPDDTQARAMPSAQEDMTAWRPLVEENLGEAALDAWLDLYIAMLYHGRLQDVRERIESSFSVVTPEGADAMAWAYIEALREYKDTLIKYRLTRDMQEALIYAYQGGDRFDMSMLGEDQQDLLRDMEDLELAWVPVEGMLEIRIRYDQIRAWMTACSPVCQRYLDLLAMDGQSPAVDGALQMGFDEMGEKTLAIEDFLPAVQGAPYQADVEDLYVQYLGLFLSGADHPSVLDMERYYHDGALALNPDAETAFQHVLNTAPQSYTAAAVSDWWAYLRALVEDGGKGEAALGQVWDGFDARVEQYAAEAGVRVPRLFLTVRSQTSGSGMYYSDTEYPVFYGAGVADGVLVGLENWISMDLIAFWSNAKNLSNPGSGPTLEYGYDPPSYGKYTALRLSRKTGRVVSVVADMDQYADGAHTLNYRIAYNFNPATGEEIQLEDLFESGTDPWALLEADVARQISLVRERYIETQGETATAPYDIYQGIMPDCEWYATDEGIVVVFQEHVIGSYPAGIDEFTVPWRRLADYLTE